jgi:hypothetical protein
LAIDLPILAYLSGKSISFNYFDFEDRAIKELLI